MEGREKEAKGMLNEALALYKQGKRNLVFVYFSGLMQMMNSTSLST